MDISIVNKLKLLIKFSIMWGMTPLLTRCVALVLAVLVVSRIRLSELFR